MNVKIPLTNQRASLKFKPMIKREICVRAFNQPEIMFLRFKPMREGNLTNNKTR